MSNFLTKLYERFIKPEPQIVADTIEMVMREELYDPDLHPDSNHALGKHWYTCSAVIQLTQDRKVTQYASKLTRDYLMQLLSPWCAFEGYVHGNPDDFPTLQGIEVTNEQMQRARRKWLTNLVEILRDRSI